MHPAKIWVLEDLLASHGAPSRWGNFDENAAAGLCSTSGTTGSPKGIVYTHRSNYLHTLRALQADAFGLTLSRSSSIWRRSWPRAFLAICR